MKPKYVLTYDLKILYTPNAQLLSNCKELNPLTLQFYQYHGDKEDFNLGFEIEVTDISTLTLKILNGKIGTELPEDDMKWLEKFEELLDKNTNLITNKNYAYNYFILKLALLGFNIDFAKEFITRYYVHIVREDNVAHPQILLNKINQLIAKKSFWVKNDLAIETKKEYYFFRKVVKSKLELGYAFSFDALYKEEYISLCRDAIVTSLIKFNRTESYLIKNKREVNDIMPLLLDEYSRMLKKIITDLYNRFGYIPEELFLNNLIKEVVNAVKFYISMYGEIY